MHKNRKRDKGILLLTIINSLLIFAAVLLMVLGTHRTRRETEAAEKAVEDKIGALEEQVQTLTGTLEAEKERVKALETQIAQQQEEQMATAENLPVPEELKSGTIVNETISAEQTAEFFQAYEIVKDDEIYQQINGKSYRENDNIGLDELRYLKVLHYNFEHQIQVGEIIVNVAVAEDVLNIFQELFAAEYEIQSMFLIDNYWTGDGDSTDTASIEENNTSGFNYREITGGGSLSRHAYGCAIDINPQQNPYVWYSGGEKRWTHSNASPYIDRSSGDPHVIVEGDICYSIFEKYGFSWGGNWSDPIDYQHFEKRL
ncbi:MAG: M15 family metallopeptidase [Clostridiales bacterium]|nr:M15 family metallopeptidase [Clostridiales bacterium]